MRDFPFRLEQEHQLRCAAVPFRGVLGNHGGNLVQQRIRRFFPKLCFRMIQLPEQLLRVPNQVEPLIGLISADDLKGGIQIGSSSPFPMVLAQVEKNRFSFPSTPNMRDILSCNLRYGSGLS